MNCTTPVASLEIHAARPASAAPRDPGTQGAAVKLWRALCTQAPGHPRTRHTAELDAATQHAGPGPDSMMIAGDRRDLHRPPLTVSRLLLQYRSPHLHLYSNQGLLTEVQSRHARGCTPPRVRPCEPSSRSHGDGSATIRLQGFGHFSALSLSSQGLLGL